MSGLGSRRRGIAGTATMLGRGTAVRGRHVRAAPRSVRRRAGLVPRSSARTAEPELVDVRRGVSPGCRGPAPDSRTPASASGRSSVTPPHRSAASRGLAIPKSSSRGSPSSVTRMLEGFRSRCTTSARWAAPTARATSMNSGGRACTVPGAAGRAKAIDPLAFDVFHGEPWLAVLGQPPVDEARICGCLSRARIGALVRSGAPNRRPRLRCAAAGATRCSYASSPLGEVNDRHAAAAQLARPPWPHSPAG